MQFLFVNAGLSSDEIESSRPGKPSHLVPIVLKELVAPCARRARPVSLEGQLHHVARGVIRRRESARTARGAAGERRGHELVRAGGAAAVGDRPERAIEERLGVVRARQGIAEAVVGKRLVENTVAPRRERERRGRVRRRRHRRLIDVNTGGVRARHVGRAVRVVVDVRAGRDGRSACRPLPDETTVIDLERVIDRVVAVARRDEVVREDGLLRRLRRARGGRRIRPRGAWEGPLTRDLGLRESSARVSVRVRNRGLRGVPIRDGVNPPIGFRDGGGNGDRPVTAGDAREDPSWGVGSRHGAARAVDRPLRGGHAARQRLRP